MFENFPYVNFHDLNLDWIIQKVKEAYSPDNPPEAVVLSVNGETGDVILYRDAVVTLPDVQESQWNIHRLANGQSSGIQFIQGDKAQRIDGTHRYDMYDAGNPPPYPVRSVNGMTGAVTVVKSVNGDNGDVWLYPEAIIEFPDTSENFFQMKRTAAGTDIGIEFNKNGAAKRLNDTDEYEIYDEGNPPPYPVTSVGTLTGAVAILDTSIVTDQGTQKLKIAFPVTSVDGQTGTVETWGYSDDENIKLPLEAEADIWSISREVPSGELGVRLTVNGLTDNPEGYLILNDGTNTTALKILTPADIPSSSGVVSVNGANGVVVLYATDIAMSTTDSATSINAAISAVDAKTGADIAVSGSDATKIDTALSSLTTAINNNAASIDSIEDSIAIVANNNTHGAISSGQFVYIKNHGTLTEGLYKANTNIAANATLSNSNLIAINTGGLNELTSDISTLNNNMSSDQKNLALQDFEGTAPRSIKPGEFIYWNNVLYRAKQNISGGTVLTSSILESVQMTNASSLPGALNVINGNISNYRSIGQVTDANIPTSMLSVGCVHYFYGLGSMSNMPTGVAGSWAISGFVFTGTSNAYGTQMLYAFGKVYCRQLSAGTYGEWTTIV